MSKASRLAGAVIAAATAFTIGAAPAMADTTPYHDDDDFKWYGQELTSVDGNYKVFRAAGRDRVDTAIQLMCHATNKKWRSVIIARSDDFADALTSGPLADVRDAALLIMPPGVIDARVVAAINNDCNAWRNDGLTDIKSITLIGGTGVWSEANRADLKAKTNLPVNRIAGIDRYDTAVEIAEQVSWEIWEESGAHTPLSVNAYIATGTDFADALAAGAAAAANDGIVLLTKGTEMNVRTYNYLDKQYEWMVDRIGHIEHHAVGGPAYTAMVNADVRIDAAHVGKNRYATAVKLAQTYAQDAESYTVASGETFPDAVAGGAFAANHDGPLLLTRNTFLSPETRDYLRLESDLHANVMVVGGIGSVNRDVSQQIMDALKF